MGSDRRGYHSHNKNNCCNDQNKETKNKQVPKSHETEDERINIYPH